MLQLTKLVSMSLLPVTCALGLQLNSFLKWPMFSIRPNVWGWLFSLCFCHGSTIVLRLSLGECFVVYPDPSLNTCFQIWFKSVRSLQILLATPRAGMIGQRLLSHFLLQPHMGFLFSSVMSTSKTCVLFIFFCFMVSWNNVQNTTMKVSQNL